MAEIVAIIGGGYSGAMLAARLAERGVRSRLINRSADFGLGVAYSTPFDGHLLNVRSGRMSAVDGQPDHFVRWLRIHRPDLADPDGFAPRRVFGDYVRDRLKTVERAHPGLIEPVVGEVAAIEADGVRLADGRRIAADAVVLATGNPAPRTTRTGAASPGFCAVISDPWAAGALDRIGRDHEIAIIGTGLTMVDMLLTLEGRGWTGRATALSRRGLMPRAHGERPDTPMALSRDLAQGPVSQRLRAARQMSDRAGWRSVMEGLRPYTAELWTAADIDTRARMVRHLRPWWDVHRHRIADSIAATLERLRGEGRLTVQAGRVRAIEDNGAGATLAWTPRHGPAQPPLTARWLIDCTGPGHDPARDPLTGPLIASGRARMDGLGLGLDLDAAGRVIAADGRADPDLFVLGPPARAAFWETIAVPDIRRRIEDVVRALEDRP